MKFEINTTKVPIKVWASELEEEAEEAELQARNLANMPFIFKHLSLMADAHAGKGSTIGTVIATDGAIIPAAVGVDIGCGMCAVKLPFGIDALASKIGLVRSAIEAAIPVGMKSNVAVSETARLAFESGA
jgi:tRNA-splicing ligase RtcB (3'-phosphate/5'-hydroxy nucleic acid ligase)